LALTAFFKIIKEINRLAASEKLTKSISNLALPEFEKMLDILGLKISLASVEEKKAIDELLEKREQLRKAKNYEEADRIRDKITQMGIELVDHKGRTIWMKKEKIKAE